MDYEEACKRLRNHANLPDAGEEDASLGYTICCLRGGQEVTDRIPQLYDDVITCFEVVNQELNGEMPSKTPGSEKASQIDRWLAYSVSLIIDDLLTAVVELRDIDDKTRSVLQSLAFRLEVAWGMILAGDMDSIRDCLESELIAR